MSLLARSYRSVTAIVGSSGGKVVNSDQKCRKSRDQRPEVAEWSNLALAGRSFMGPGLECCLLKKRGSR